MKISQLMKHLKHKDLYLLLLFQRLFFKNKDIASSRWRESLSKADI